MSNVTSIAEARKPRSWNRLRWDWQRLVLASDLSMTAKTLAACLVSQFAHHESAECRPGVEALAEALNTSADSVKRALRDLEAGGWIVRAEGRGRGNRLAIGFQFPAREKGADLPGFDAGKGGNPAPLSAAEKGASLRGKGCKSARPPTPPYKAEPNLNQRSGGEKPVSHLACRIAADGHLRDGWDIWLRQAGFPDLEGLGWAIRDGLEYEVPLRHPPEGPVQTRIATKWAEWATGAGKG